MLRRVLPRTSTNLNITSRRYLLGFGNKARSKAHNPGKIEYGADKWQTKLKDIPESKSNLKKANNYIEHQPRFPPLTERLPGAPAFSTDHALKVPTTEITTLKNGIKVASEDSYNQTCCIGLLLNAGIRTEPKDSAGVSFMLETMAFKNTKTRNRDELSKLLQDIGGHVSTFSDRETLSFQIDILRDQLPLAVEILSDSLINMEFTDEDISAQADAFKAEVQANAKEPSFLLQNTMFSTAYPNPGLGRTLINTADALQDLTAQDLRDYITSSLTGPNVTISGASVDHDAFVALVEKNFGSLPSKSPIVSKSTAIIDPKPKYKGGISKIEAPSDMEFAHFSITFEIPGWINHKDSVVVAVLQKMLGGGTSFSSGGPGKGMHSRLYTRVLNKHWWSEACEGVALALSDTGLFGVSSACRESKKYFNECVETTCREVISLLIDPLINPPNFAVDLNRAKNQLKTSMFMNLEHRSILFDDIARQVSIYGFRYAPAELSQMIDDVTSDDVVRVMSAMLKTEPTAVAIAPKRELNKMHDFEEIKALIKEIVNGHVALKS